MKHKILLTFAILTLTIPVSTANAKGGGSHCVKIYTNQAASGWIMNCEGRPKHQPKCNTRQTRKT